MSLILGQSEVGGLNPSSLSTEPAILGLLLKGLYTQPGARLAGSLDRYTKARGRVTVERRVFAPVALPPCPTPNSVETHPRVGATTAVANAAEPQLASSWFPLLPPC